GEKYQPLQCRCVCLRALDNDDSGVERLLRDTAMKRNVAFGCEPPLTELLSKVDGYGTDLQVPDYRVVYELAQRVGGLSWEISTTGPIVELGEDALPLCG